MLFITSCSKKELPQSTSNDPVFYFKGIIGSDSVNYTAGDNGIFMHTNYYLNNQSVYTLKGLFGSFPCDTCNDYLSFEFTDADKSSTSSLSSGVPFFFKDSVFHSYSFDSISVSAQNETFLFTPELNAPGASYFWDFGDGTTSTLINPTHQYNGQGLVNVKLIVSYQNMTDSMKNTIDASAFSTCRTKFTYAVDSTNTVFVQAENLSFANYDWDFGNGQVGNGEYDTMAYANPGSYIIKLTASFGSCVTSFSKKVNINNGIQLFVPNFVYRSLINSVITTTQRVNTRACVITYHKGNNLYKSYKNTLTADQHDRIIFTSTEVKDYTKNSKNQSTLIIAGNTDTYLYNVSNPQDSIAIKSNEIRLGVAYPN
jgi:PKD repeat protein